jgi:signal transduction histidine kinase
VDRSVVAGISIFRWLAWGWMATVLFFDQHALVRPWLAYALVALALVVSVFDSFLLGRRPDALLGPVPATVELACGAALFLGGGLAYGHGAAFATSQSLGVAWPLAGVFTAGVAGGSGAGVVAGVAIGLTRSGGAMVNGVSIPHLFAGGQLVGTLTPIVLFAMAGGALGYLAALLRRAESVVAAVRAREEVARTLHDGVLQTLAVVERRTGDQDLAHMARDQQRELRAYLAGPPTGNPREWTSTGREDLVAGLRASAARFERRFEGRVDIVVMDELPTLSAEAGTALTGAVGEALTNAGKHGQASHVTIFVEPDQSSAAGRRSSGRLFCSVKDDGLGFDPDAITEGMGISRSIRGRITEVGGRVEISGQLGGGAEVRLWM